MREVPRGVCKSIYPRDVPREVARLSFDLFKPLRRSPAPAHAPPTLRLLDSAMLAALRGMSLRGGSAPGSIAGAHRGGVPGAGEDFFQHRAYVRGEDLRGIDFRASARVGHLLVKERHRPVRRGLLLLVDLSASMDFPKEAESKTRESKTGMSKAEVARKVGAALAYLALQEGDSVSLLVLESEGPRRVGRRVPQGRAGASAEALLAAATRATAQNMTVTSSSTLPGANPGATAGALGLEAIDPSFVSAAHVVLLSDLYGDESRISRGLRLIRGAAAEVTVFHTLAGEDLALPESTVVRDAETGEQLYIDAAERAAMSARVLSWRDRLRTGTLRAGAGFVELDARQHPAAALRQWLAQR